MGLYRFSHCRGHRGGDGGRDSEGRKNPEVPVISSQRKSPSNFFTKFLIQPQTV